MRRRAPGSLKGLEALGRVRLSASFFLRDFLHSEIADFHGIPNIPSDPDLAIAAGTRLCEELLEPLQRTFGRVAIRSAYRSEAVNRFGNENGFNCARNSANHAAHIWDRRDTDGCMGATACVVVPWVWDRYQQDGDWQRLAWWIKDHLPYGSLCFFPKLWAVNIQWHEAPRRDIRSYTVPKGLLTRPGMDNYEADHSTLYADFPLFKA